MQVHGRLEKRFRDWYLRRLCCDFVVRDRCLVEPSLFDHPHVSSLSFDAEGRLLTASDNTGIFPPQHHM